MLGFDLFNYFYPGKVFAAEALRRGELPLWNPNVFFGVPFLANIQMGVLYPPNLIFVALDFPRAVALSQWFHLVIGGIGTYLLCRWAWQLGALASLTGALVFAGSGFFGAHMGHLNQVHAASWLPWLALCQFRLAAALGAARRTRTAKQAVAGFRLLPSQAGWMVAGGVVVALQFTAGHTQEVYYTLFALGLLAAGFTVLPPAWAPQRWTHLPAIALLVCNGVFLAAAQLLPTVELSRFSYRRGGMPLEEAVGFGVERTHLLESLLPTFYSLPNQEVIGYAGVVALALACAAIVSPARRTVLALAALAFLSVTLTLAAYTPVFPLLHSWAPMFGSFRAPGRWLLIWTFAVAGLAAHGADALRFRSSPTVREAAAGRYAFTIASLACALLFFTWRSQEVHAIHWLPHARVAVLWLLAGLGSIGLALTGIFARLPWPRVALALGLVLELGYAAREMEYNHPGTSALYLEQPPIARVLRSAPSVDPAVPDRTLSLAAEERLDGERLRRAVPEGGDYRRYAAMRDVVRPNLGTVYGLPSIDGYDGGLLPLREFSVFKQLLVTHEPPVPHFTLAPQAPPRPDARLLGALNVRSLLTDGRGGHPGAGWITQEDVPTAAYVHQNANVSPRARVVFHVIAEPVPDRALGLVRSLDWSTSAVVERPVPGISTEPAGASPLTAARGEARIVALTASRVEIDVTAAQPGLLTVTDTYYPGWRASVDGKEAPVVRANVLFRGVPVPAGAHHVILSYDPLSVKAGFALSAVALMANAALLWRFAFHRRRPVGAWPAATTSASSRAE